jgi:tetratricopeptide (TPR) repeat protein
VRARVEPRLPNHGRVAECSSVATRGIFGDVDHERAVKSMCKKAGFFFLGVLALGAAIYMSCSRATEPAATVKTELGGDGGKSITDRLRAAKTPAAVEAIAQDVVAAFLARRDEDRKEWLLQSLGLAWARVGNQQRAMECYERLGREWPEHRLIALMLQISVLTERGDLLKAESRTEQFVATSAGRDRNTAIYLLAGVEFHREAPDKALKALDVWSPELARSNERPMVSLQRARCLFKLGNGAAALDVLEAALLDAASLSDELGSADAESATRSDLDRTMAVLERPTASSSADEMGGAYAEFAARSGRLDRAKAFIARLPDGVSGKCRPSMRIVEAWIGHEPAGVMGAVTGTREFSQLDLAGRLLQEIGQRGIPGG